jgi:hypothetical protein
MRLFSCQIRDGSKPCDRAVRLIAISAVLIYAASFSALATCPDAGPGQVSLQLCVGFSKRRDPGLRTSEKSLVWTHPMQVQSCRVSMPVMCVSLPRRPSRAL